MSARESAAVHVCNARCDRGGHYMLAAVETKPKHRYACTDPCPRDSDPCSACEGGALGNDPGYQPRHRAEVTP